MLIVGLCRGIRNGWLDASFKENVKRAYNGLLRNKIKADGTVTDVCMGSGNSTDVNYYMQLGTVENDDHGTGVILTAISEMIQTI
jgi:rhamnogalacturonyl hydrolase YesR